VNTWYCEYTPSYSAFSLCHSERSEESPERSEETSRDSSLRSKLTVKKVGINSEKGR